MKKSLIIIGIIVILGIVATLVVLPGERKNDDNYIGHTPEECATIQVMCVEGMERFDDENGCGCQPITLPENWKTYISDSMNFSMNYDPSLTVQVDHEAEVRFFHNGPTQKGQTEMYDGMLLSIQKIKASDGVQLYIDTHVQEVSESATITVPLHEGILNGLPMQTFDASGLGDFTTIFIPVDDRSLLELSYMVIDPTNVGFLKTMDMMLSSINLIR